MRSIRTIVISILAVSLLAGSGIGVTAQDEEAAAASTGCDEPLAEPGVYEGLNEFEGAAQAYRVVIPESYADLAPAPLVLFLASGFPGRLDPAFELWRPYLGPAESIFVVADMEGYTNKQSSTLIALIDQLVAAYCIDPRRVHAMGRSSSSPIVADLVCDASAPVASFSAGMGFFPPLCASPRPLPLMAITGDEDRGPVSTSVERWAESNGCDAEPVAEDLGSGVTRKTYQGCDADVVLYDIEGAGHGFIRQECLVGTDFDWCIKNDLFDDLQEVERFIAAHPLATE